MKHLRPLNLLMLAFTQGVCGWYLFREGGEVSFASLALLIFSTVCITAAGYLINDYYDRAIDARNKPQKALPNTPAAKKNALLLYSGLNVLGFLASIPPTINAGKPSLLFIQAGTIALLWIYSKWWKRLPVIGNVTVAGLTALSIMILYWYHPRLWGTPGITLYPIFKGEDLRYQWWLQNRYLFGIPYNNVLFCFAGFAFLLTWMREMVKDVEDMEGDHAEGCKTLPIVWGLKPVVAVISLLGAGAIFLLFRSQVFQQKVVLLLTAVPLVVWIGYLYSAKTSKDFGRLSNALKLIMLGGLVFLLLI